MFFISIILVMAIIFGVFSSIGWCIGIFNRNLNQHQRTKAGMFLSIFFILMIGNKGCQWSNGLDKLEEKRGNVFRSNNPGYYDLNSINVGNERPESYELIKAKEAIKEYDDKMAKVIIYWILGYLLLFLIGFIGENMYPLLE